MNILCDKCGKVAITIEAEGKVKVRKRIGSSIYCSVKCANPPRPPPKNDIPDFLSALFK